MSRRIACVAASLLRGTMGAAGQAGFAGMQDVEIPQAPGVASASPFSAPADETTQAVAALVDFVQKSGKEKSPQATPSGSWE